MTIDTKELRRKANSTDVEDHIYLHANIRPLLSELIDRLEAAEIAQKISDQTIYDLRAKIEATETKPASSIAKGWKEAAIAWEVCGSLHREYAKGKDPFFKKRQEDFVKHANDARTMLAAAPEAKP